jgi:histidine triad (HIT) family protein
MHSDCIFCRILNGEIPAHKLYEDDLFVVILDAFPASCGHLLIIPKRHAKDIHELNTGEAAALYPLAQKMAAKLTATLTPDGIRVQQNNGKAAGQEVFHFHLHLIPHYEVKTPTGELAEVAALLAT